MDVAMQLNVGDIWNRKHLSIRILFGKNFSARKHPHLYFLLLIHTHNTHSQKKTMHMAPETKLLPAPLYSAPSKTNYYVPTPSLMYTICNNIQNFLV